MIKSRHRDLADVEQAKNNNNPRNERRPSIVSSIMAGDEDSGCTSGSHDRTAR